MQQFIKKIFQYFMPKFRSPYGRKCIQILEIYVNTTVQTARQQSITRDIIDYFCTFSETILIILSDKFMASRNLNQFTRFSSTKCGIMTFNEPSC